MATGKSFKKLDFALEYASRGWSIFPVGRGKDKKAPYIQSWKEYQTKAASPEQIREWWTKWPDAGIAVVTGRISGISVVDVDRKPDPETGYIQTGNSKGLTVTLTAESGGGGWHFYYHYVENLKSYIGFRDLVDLKSDGGYIILPPSDHKSGSKYEWLTPLQEISPFPVDVLEEIRQSSKSSREQVEVVDENSLAKVPVGTRNDWFASVIGKAISGRTDPLDKDIKQLIFLANQGNSEPLPPDELNSTYISIINREIAKRDTPTINKEIGVFTAKELGKKVFPDAKWVVQDLFEANSVNMLSAAPGSYKTWITFHLAMCLASGQPLFGKFEVDKQGVLFLNEEDDARRFQERMNLMDSSGAWQDLPIYISARGMNQFKFTAETVDDVINLAKEKGVGFIIFDALKSLTLGKENDSDEMQKVMDCFKRLTDAGFSVLITHHNRKKSGFSKQDNGEEIRGSTAILAALDGHLTCDPQKDENVILIDQAKSKGGPIIETFRVINNLGMGGDPFVYDGVQKKKDTGAQAKNKAKILSILGSHEEWLSINDLIKLKAGQKETLRDVLKEMTMIDSTIEAKTWKEVGADGLATLKEGGAYNEKFYHLANKEEEKDKPPDI